jgi:hypothetical protein
MGNAHPSEIELARLAERDDLAADAETLDHLRWCARCRTLVADYRWLQDEMVSALGSTAGAARIPRPRWWAVHQTLIAGQRRQNAAGRISAIASAVLAVCLMFFQPLLPGPSLLGGLGLSQASQQAPPALVVSYSDLYPEAAVATAPTAAVSSDASSGLVTVATPTPPLVASGHIEKMASQSTPACMQLPTPPQPEALNL